MFSLLIVAYLFLAGSGCGAFLSVAVLSYRARFSASLARPLSEIVLPALVVSCVMIAIGLVCLVFDLGRPLLALSVLLYPFSSILSLGAWALLFCMLIFIVLIADNMGVVSLSAKAAAVVEAAGCVVSVVVMVYSGLFLSTIWTIPFLASPFVVILFVLSSLSCGGGVILLLPLMCDVPVQPIFDGIVSFDRVILVLEVIALGVYIALSLNNPRCVFAAKRLVSGDLSALFWVVLVGCGLVVPGALEICASHVDEKLSAVTGIALLVGGAALRYCLCFAPFNSVL